MRVALARSLALVQYPSPGFAGMLGQSFFQHGKSSGRFPPQPLRRDSGALGQGIVEFALVLPFLMLVLLGAVDLARAFQTKIVVTNSAREGARYGSTHPTQSSSIQGQAVAEASRSGVSITVAGPVCFQLDDITNTPIPCSSAANGDRLMVTVSANFQFATLYLFHFSSITIADAATMPIITGGAEPP